jgi:CHAD domain-containing protein
LLLRRLEQRRAKRQKKVARAINRFQKQGVLEDMTQTVKRVRSASRSQGPAADGIRVRAGDAIRSRLEALAALEPCVSQPENIEAHHAMRIAAKRLRYTLEVFRPLYGKPTARFIAAARNAQRMLGQIHDCDVWVEFLPQFLEKEERQAAAMAGGARPMRRLRPGLLFLQEDRRRQRERLFEGFSALWQKWQGDGLWEELRELLRARPVEERPRAVLSSPPAAA